MEVKYVDWGIANNFGTHIEMNKELKKYPKLHNNILKHELRHTNKIFTKQDLNNDLIETNVDPKQLFLFIIKNPKSLSQFLPLYFSRDYGIVYDLNLILVYSIIIIFIVFGAFIGYSI